MNPNVVKRRLEGLLLLVISFSFWSFTNGNIMAMLIFLFRVEEKLLVAAYHKRAETLRVLQEQFLSAKLNAEEVSSPAVGFWGMDILSIKLCFHLFL